MAAPCIDIQRFMHVGVVVHSIEQTLRNMKRFFSIECCRINQFPPEDLNSAKPQLMYHEEKAWFTARFCFISVGSTEVELIEPLEGDSVWKDFLREHGEGVHHLKYEVESLNETIQAFRQMGISCLQYGSAVGSNAGKTWAYFDTEPQLGYVIEVLNTQCGEIVCDMEAGAS